MIGDSEIPKSQQQPAASLKQTKSKRSSTTVKLDSRLPPSLAAGSFVELRLQPLSSDGGSRWSGVRDRLN
jgi:hypothetical protein